MSLWVELVLMFSMLQPQSCCMWTALSSCMDRQSSIALSTTSNNEERNEAEAAAECESEGLSHSTVHVV